MRAGIDRAGFAVAQVIVMGADDDRLVAVRAGAFEDGGHVFDLGFLPVDVDFAARAPAGQHAAVRRRAFVDFDLELFQRGAERLLDHAVDRPAADPKDRKVAGFAGQTGPVERQQRIVGVAQLLAVGFDLVGQFVEAFLLLPPEIVVGDRRAP